MVSARRFQTSGCVLFLALFFVFAYSISGAEEHRLVVSQSTSLQLSRGVPAKNSPGSKPGSTVVCERVHIQGLSRIKNLRKVAHTVKVKVSMTNSSARMPNIEVCFHRNMSLGIGMCPQSQWDKVVKGSWAQSMSPFDYKLLDIRTSGISLESLEVSIEEEFFLYRIIFLILGMMLMSLASSLSKSLVFYYGSAMATGVLLVVLMVLYQGMKLLPTGRKNSLAIFIYASAVGLGSFFLRYIPGLFHQVLLEMGISEDMYKPLAAFLLAFIFLTGAWLGFWVVHKFILAEDGSIDISTSLLVAWSIRTLAVLLILQCSLDPLLATGVLICGLIALSMLRRIFKLRFLRRQYKKLFKSPKKIHKRTHISDSPSFDDSPDEFIFKSPPSYEDPRFRRSQSKNFNLMSCTSKREVYPSTFHYTPKRRKFSKDEWESFTKDSTEKALEELVSSPDFSNWLVENAERISITRQSSRAEKRRKWLGWF